MVESPTFFTPCNVTLKEKPGANGSLERSICQGKRDSRKYKVQRALLDKKSSIAGRYFAHCGLSDSS